LLARAGFGIDIKEMPFLEIKIRTCSKIIAKHGREILEMGKKIRLLSFFALLALGVNAHQPLASAPSGNGGAVLGRVYEVGPRSPVAHAIVMVRNQEDGSEKTGVAAADGTFFIAPLAPGQYAVRITCAGFQEYTLSGYPVKFTTAAMPAKIGLARIGSGRESAAVKPAAPPAVAQPLGLGRDQSSSEIRIRWNAATQASRTAQGLNQAANAGAFSLVEKQQSAGPMPRQRMPELSPDQILVVFMDDKGEQEDWALIQDPRILRAETPGPNGELRGNTIYRSNAEFLVPFSRSLRAASLKFYQPRWTGKEFSLDLLGALAIP
jgi:hypothetical protein